MSFKDFFSSFFTPYLHVPVTGLDLSDRTGKFVQFSFASHKKVRLLEWGQFDVPAGLIESGEIKREPDLTLFLKKWLRDQSKWIRRSFFALSLPEEKSFLRIVQIPKIKEQTLASALQWAIEEHIPLARTEMVYDYETIEPLKDHLDHADVLVIAYPKALVESYVRVCQDAGIRLAALEPESQAIARATIPVLRDQTVRILVDLGRLRTSITLFAGGTILFTTTIPLGGALFEENIAKALNVPLEQAKELKKKAGLHREGEDAKVYEALAPSISVLTDEIRKAMAYYREHPEHTHGALDAVSAISLTGGDANLVGLETYLSSALKVPAEKSDSFLSLKDLMASPIPSMPQGNTLEFTSAIGLALRGIRMF